MLWAIFNLSRNPGAQRRLLEEIRTVVPPNQDPTGEHIKSMPYLKACLKESMRYSRTGTAAGRATLSDATHLADNQLACQDLHKPSSSILTGDEGKDVSVLNQNRRSIKSPDKTRGKLTRSKTSSVSYGAMTSNR